jgi:hypothetical protein
MEVDSKDSEIEQLSQKLASASADTVSNISSGAENESEEGVQVSVLEHYRRPVKLKSTQNFLGFLVGRLAFCSFEAKHTAPWLAEAVRGRLI